MKPRYPIRQPERHRKTVPRVRARQKLGTPEFLDHGFLDQRSYVVTRTGRIVLRGADYSKFRWQVYGRAGGRCELDKPNGTRCNKFAPFDGYGHGELAHTIHRSRGGSDAPENAKWSCGISTNHAGGLEPGCHRKQDHPGPQWSAVRRRALEAGQNPAQPESGMDANV